MKGYEEKRGEKKKEEGGREKERERERKRGVSSDRESRIGRSRSESTIGGRGEEEER